MKFTLRSKLFALTTLMVTLIMVDTTSFYTIRQRRDRLAAAGAEAERLARNVATMKLVDYQDWSAYQQFISNLIAFNRDVVFIAVYDERQALRAQALNADLVEGATRLATSRRAEAELVRKIDAGAVTPASRDDLKTARVNIQVGDRVLGSVHVGISLIDIRRELESGLERNLALAAVWFAISGLLSFVLSRRLTGPIERLSIAMSAIARGDLEQRVRPESHDEIGALARTFNDMAEGLRERQIIDRLGQELASTFELERLVELVRARLSVAIGAITARLFLRESEGAPVFRELGAQESRPHVHLDRSSEALLLDAADGVGGDGCPLAMRDAMATAGISPSELLLPLPVKGRLLGFVAFRISGGAAGLAGPRRHFAAILARQAALALDNAVLYSGLAERQRLEGELSAAREAQRRLLPLAMPAIPGWAFDAVCRPALEVGGDYFDFLDLGADRLGIVIADVSGKGTSASMYMAQIKGMMHSLGPLHAGPRRTLEVLNQQFHPGHDRRVFASALYGVLEPAAGVLTFARAGHSPVILLHAAGPVEALTPEGMAIGLDPGPLFGKALTEARLRLEPGDTFLLYTDGLTDAMSRSGESFGLARLLEFLGRERTRPLPDLRLALLAELTAFTAGTEPFDDLTLLLVRRLRPTAGGTGTSPRPERRSEQDEHA